MEPHGLDFDPFKACIVPRPIAWVSTISTDGKRNLAPFSFFNAFAWAPPMVALGMPGRKPDATGKDTLLNIEATGEFVVNMATYDLRKAVNETSRDVGPEIDE